MYAKKKNKKQQKQQYKHKCYIAASTHSSRVNYHIHNHNNHYYYYRWHICGKLLINASNAWYALLQVCMYIHMHIHMHKAVIYQHEVARIHPVAFSEWSSVMILYFMPLARCSQFYSCIHTYIYTYIQTCIHKYIHMYKNLCEFANNGYAACNSLNTELPLLSTGVSSLCLFLLYFILFYFFLFLSNRTC